MPMPKALMAVVAILSATILTVAAPSARQAAVAAPDPEAAARAALARPINAGSIPFLLPHSRYSNVAGRIAAALQHERADVRAVAARSIFVTAGKVYSDAVASALTTERDPVAGAEMVRAMMAIRGGASDADAIAAARRLGAPAINAVIVTMAHARPLDVLPYLADLDADATALADALLRAVSADPDRVARALGALPDGLDLAAVSTMFTRAGDIGIALPSSVVESTLRRTSRRAALVYLLNRPETAVPATLAAIRATPASPASGGWDDVLVELYARGNQSSQRRDLLTIIPRLDRGSAPAGFWRWPAISRLSSEEMSAIQTQVPGQAAGDAPAVRDTVAGPRPPDPRWREKSIWRTVDPRPASMRRWCPLPAAALANTRSA